MKCGLFSRWPVRVVRQVLMLLSTGAVLAGLAACPSGHAPDKAKFAGIDSAAEAIKIALASGGSCQQLTGLTDRLSKEIAALNGRAKTKEEGELLKAYSDLLAIYRDGLLLWKYSLEFAAFDFVPKGRIYVGQDIEPIVFKYRFSTEEHLYESTGKYWKSIPEDSMKIIWANADSELKLIERMRSE